MKGENHTLETETRFYEKIKSELLTKFEGKFVLIKGEEFVGAFDSQDAAYSEGLKRFGNAPMLIKKVQRDEPQVWIPALQLGLIRADIHR